MSIRIRTLVKPTGYELGVVVERLDDGLCYDFLNKTFKADPNQPVSDRLTRSGPSIFTVPCSWGLTIPGDAFRDGYYYYTVHPGLAAGQDPAMLLAAIDSGYFLCVGGSDQWDTVPIGGPVPSAPPCPSRPGQGPPQQLSRAS